jgi:hypothetical protein
MEKVEYKAIYVKYANIIERIMKYFKLRNYF